MNIVKKYTKANKGRPMLSDYNQDRPMLSDDNQPLLNHLKVLYLNQSQYYQNQQLLYHDHYHHHRR